MGSAAIPSDFSPPTLGTRSSAAVLPHQGLYCTRPRRWHAGRDGTPAGNHRDAVGSSRLSPSMGSVLSRTDGVHFARRVAEVSTPRPAGLPDLDTPPATPAPTAVRR